MTAIALLKTSAMANPVQAAPKGRLSPTLAVAALVGISIIPVLAVKLPPLVDLLGHIGRYAVQTKLDQSTALQQYYDFDWKLIGNLGADLIVQMLSPFCSVETATRIIVILNQLLAAAGLLLLSREVHGRITPFAIFALPLIYSFPFNYGFINFTLSMALALLAFTLWLRLGRTGKHRLRACLFAFLGMGIWMCHTFGWGFLGLLCGAASLVDAARRENTRIRTLIRVAWTCLPLAAPLVPMLLWRGEAGDAHTGVWMVSMKLNWLASVLRLQWMWLDVASAGLLYALVYSGYRERQLAIDPVPGTAALLCLIVFLLMPARMFGSFYADMRLTPYMLAIALLAIDDSRLSTRKMKIISAVALAFLLLRIGVTTHVYVRNERAIETQMAALSAIPDGSRVVSLIEQRCWTWAPPLLVHLGGLGTERSNIFANNQWLIPGINLLTIRYEAAAPFVADPSQLVYPAQCTENGPTMDDAIKAVPLKAVTHVWAVGIDAKAPPVRDGLTPVWRKGNAIVYRTQ